MNFQGNEILLYIVVYVLTQSTAKTGTEVVHGLGWLGGTRNGRAHPKNTLKEKKIK